MICVRRSPLTAAVFPHLLGVCVHNSSSSSSSVVHYSSAHTHQQHSVRQSSSPLHIHRPPQKNNRPQTMSAPASSSSSSSSSSSTPATSSHAAITYFNTKPTSFVNLSSQNAHDRSWYALGHKQLAAALGVKEKEQTPSFDETDPVSIPASAAGGWLTSEADEQKEIIEFLAWVKSSDKFVRQIIDVLPASMHSSVASIASAELHDFSPKGRIDDEIFAHHRDVWERITRGCTVVKLQLKDQSQQPIWRWAVRANRKFTGHEDDAVEAADAKLYCIPGSPAETVVVTHKCNGSVLHLSARDITIGGATHRWVFLGSKKVHVGCVWTNAADWEKKMQLFNEPRHAYVAEMVTYVLPHLRQRGDYILSLLAKLRLVINAEYVSSIGTGPTDNESIYNIAPDARVAYAFMLTFNTLFPGKGGELGLEPMAGLRLLDKMGFQTVSAFKIPLSELPLIKTQVTPLPDIEGTVLYYSSADGLIQLEKWKSAGYIILRAIREKLKPFVFGAKERAPSLESVIELLDAETKLSGLKVEKKVLSEQEVLEEKVRLDRLRKEDTIIAEKKERKREQRKKRVAAKKAKAKTTNEAKQGEEEEEEEDEEDGEEDGDEADEVDSAASAVAEKLKVGSGKPAAAASSSSSSVPTAAISSASNTKAAANNKAAMKPAAASASASSSTAPSLSSSTPVSVPLPSFPSYVASANTFLEFSHADLDRCNPLLMALTPTFARVSVGVWRCACPQDEKTETELIQAVKQQYLDAIVNRTWLHSMGVCITRTQGRIRQIDQIPMEEAERQMWIDDADKFIRWITHQILFERRWTPKKAMDAYSKMYSLFRQEQQQQKKQ